VALRAVVVGGGIGGVAAAVALARAGIDVQVHEQAQQLAEVGAGVSLAPNGLRMLKRLGAGEGIGRVAARHGRLSKGTGVPGRRGHAAIRCHRPGHSPGSREACMQSLCARQGFLAC
jgi:2-polyprenyl-6-methoxyphenol hydroxylase-like FAD-dependent oxidoreductase